MNSIPFSNQFPLFSDEEKNENIYEFFNNNQNIDPFFSSGNIGEPFFKPDFEVEKVTFTDIRKQSPLIKEKDEDKDEDKSKGEKVTEKEDVNYSTGSNSNVKFNTLLYQKRGRKTDEKKTSTISSKPKIHSANDNDNIQRKIQVNFFTFLVNLANDAVHSLLPTNEKRIFLNINYKDKQGINAEKTVMLKHYNYSDILNMNISDKYIKYPLDHNKKLLNELINKNILLKKFFEQEYVLIFKKYYYNDKKPLQDYYEFEGEKIYISKKTKNFYYLLKDDGKRDLLLKMVNEMYE